MSRDDRPTMPPVRLPAEAELARDALAAPLFERAVRLARWAGAVAGTGLPVGAGGELLDARLKEAVTQLGLADDADGPAQAAQAWQLALDIGLLDVDEDGTAAGDVPGEGAGQAAGEGAGQGAGKGRRGAEPAGTARPGGELAQLSGAGSPADVLDVWRRGLESVLADAATPSFEDLLGDLAEEATGPDGQLDPNAIDLDALEWNPEHEADFLDTALGNLYLLTAGDPAVSAGAMVPLPVLAASMIVPDEMEDPTDAVLEEVSAAMMRLDEQFRLLAPTGLLEYRPVDEALTEETDEDGDLPELDEEDVSRYGMVRLTPLGLHGVRQRLREAGTEAPAVGDLAEADAARLLGALPEYTEDNAQAEISGWLAARTPLAAARELLAAAHGTDQDAPARRLSCQQALSLAGPEAEPALREVLEDRQLGGLARVWLVEHGASDVPQPDEEMVFWLTVDTLAAQLATAGEPAELQGLVQGLVDQHAGFFDKAWRVDHPATADVLDAMGRVHPDKRTAKEARKAAFKARSRLS